MKASVPVPSGSPRSVSTIPETSMVSITSSSSFDTARSIGGAISRIRGDASRHQLLVAS